MGSALKLPHEAWVLVCDGRKALFLRNEGDRLFPNLKVRQVLHGKDNPATHEQGTDRPGRVAMGTHRSATEQTDWHEIAEHRFASEISAALARLHHAEPLAGLVIVAPPRTLADLRHALPKDVRAAVLEEIDKDLTKMPADAIERHLTAA
jgi:protein required for attachment to host cells